MKNLQNLPAWVIALIIIGVIVIVSLFRLWNWVILFGVIFGVVYAIKKGWIKKLWDWMHDGPATIILVLCVLSIAGKSQAQTTSDKWNLNSIILSTGETPLTRGITISPMITKGKSNIVLDINAELGEFMYFYSAKPWISAGPSAGFYKNTPWIGPVLSFNFFKGHLTTLNWFGWSFGNPEKSTTEIKSKFLFSYHQLNFISEYFEGYYVLQHYQKNIPEHIFGVKLIFPTKNFSLFGGYGYMLHADKSLWSAGIKLNF